MASASTPGTTVPDIDCVAMTRSAAGLNKNEKKIILPLLISSILLFGIGLIFSYYVLIPAALNFFISYSAEVVEPLWSIDQYFDFILLLLYSKFCNDISSLN